MDIRSRRQFLQRGLAVAGLSLLSGCALPPPPWTATRRRPTLGFVSIRARGGTPEYAAFQEGLRELGYVPGETIQLDIRWGEPESLGPELAELAGGSDVLVAVGNGIIRAVKQATSTVPIVMVASGDPIGGGLVASLARTGGTPSQSSLDT